MAVVEVTELPDGRMDVKNAAAYLGLSTATLAAWRSKGIGPKYVKGSRVFYFKSELDVFIHARAS